MSNLRVGILGAAVLATIVAATSPAARRAIAGADRWMADKIDVPLHECKVKRLTDYVCRSKGIAPVEECLDPRPSGGVLTLQEPSEHESVVCAATPPISPVVGLVVVGPLYCWPRTVPGGSR